MEVNTLKFFQLSHDSYYPDFTFICRNTELHIDIEIDEPYSINDKTPIHYIDSTDDERNNWFLNENWCIIRFSEKQIILEPDKCINLIESVVSNILNRNLKFEYDLIKDKKWSYEESLVMALKNSRHDYLK